MSDPYDAVIIGAGPGGHAAAWDAARCGTRVAVIEKNQWGGTCTHKGCIPTKALLTCSKKYQELKNLKRLGVNAGDYSFDFSAIKRHQQQIVRVSALGVQKSLKDAGVDLIAGEGEILAPDRVRITAEDGRQETVKTRRIVIAWGSEPLVLPGLQLSDRVMTSDGLLAMDALPDSIVIVGGSIIGVEFATLLAELNVKVTLIELLGQILPFEDDEAAGLLRQELSRLGVVIHTGTRLDTVEETDAGITMKATAPAGPLSLNAGCVLLSTGRKPRLRTEELDRNGIRYEKTGIAATPDQMTTIENIYVIGDATGGMMLAHRAMQQGKALASRLFGDRSIGYREDAVPSVVYSHPNIARVGLTEKAARARGMEIDIIRSEYAANIIARTQLKNQGFVKTIFHRDKLIGCTICGDDAAELIGPMALALAAGLDRKTLKQWIVPHPTLSEVLAI